MKTLLICPPKFYSVQYEINAWMKVENAAVSVRSQKQWGQLETTLLGCGAKLLYLEPQSGVPDLVFTANAGLVRNKKVVLSSFLHPERQKEEPFFDKWFLDNGYTVEKVTKGSFEGEGDALFWGDTLIGGYGFRTDVAIYPEVAGILSISHIETVEMIDPRFYHLDTCFCPLADGKGFFFPGAFTPDSQQKLRALGELFAVPEEEAVHFACNAVVLGKHIVLPTGCPQTEKYLRSVGYTTYSVEMDEFLKAGGAAKCLTLYV